MELEEGGEVSRAIDEGKKATFEPTLQRGINVVPDDYPPKLKDPGSFSIACMVGRVKIDRALCDLGVSVSLMPSPICQKLG